MKFKVGSKVRIKNLYSGGNFDNGDIVTVEQIGNEDESDCYGAISPYDGLMWYLNEDEVGAITNADHIRAMSDEELASIIKCPYKKDRKFCTVPSCFYCTLNWLQQPLQEE